MNRAVLLTLLACAASTGADSPPLPSPPIPSPAVAVTAAALPSAAPVETSTTAKVAAKEARKRPRAPTFRLGEKHESQEPDWTGAGEIPKGEVVAKVEENELVTFLGGEAYSHSFLGHHSRSLASIQLVQEFDILPGDPEDPRVLLTLGGKLDGYLRSETKGTACLRLADATVYPACGGPTLGVSFPPSSSSGNGSHRCEAETQSPSLLLLAGRYVLVVRLVLETNANGLFRGHAEAVFSPGGRAGTWTSKDNPPPDLEGEDFGLAVTLRADAPVPD